MVLDEKNRIEGKVNQSNYAGMLRRDSWLVFNFAE